MRRFKVVAVAALICSAASITAVSGPAMAAEGMAAGKWEAGVHGGTLGLGVNAGYSVSERFKVRALFSQFGLDYEGTESGNEYKGDLDLRSFGLFTDWHPFSGRFRVTGGALHNGNEVTATAEGEALDIGGTSYDARLNILLDFEPIAPYLGIGFGSVRQEPGFGFTFDAGLLYQRSPQLSGNGNAGRTGAANAERCSFAVSPAGNATLSGGGCGVLSGLKSDLESEYADLTDELEDFKWYPVLSLGVLYRF